jgi:hypothetical protein
MTAKGRFGDAFDKGIVAADKADAAQRSIESVILLMGQTIHSKTDGLVSIYSEATPTEVGRGITGAIGEALGQPDAPRSKTLGVFASAQFDKQSHRERICLLTLSKMSFPVQVQWAGETQVCNSVESLVTALEAVLENPHTGRKLRQLLDWYNRAKDSARSDDGKDGDTK